MLSNDLNGSRRVVPPYPDTVELQDFAASSDNGDEDMLIGQEDTLEDSPSKPQEWKKQLLKLAISFFLFGLFNEILYVIIISAALDLVPPSTPKGIILFCSIFPALLAKLIWSYLVKGQIQYTQRVVRCALLNTTSMLIVAMFESVPARLLGICLGSFSSGLAELTFLQMSTTYTPSLGGRSVGHFASGAGAAGLFGAFLWWEIRGLGVRVGVGVSAILPLLMPLTYFFLLPRPAVFTGSPSLGPYVALPEEDPDIAAVEASEGNTLLGGLPKVPVYLTAGDKWHLVKSMILKYMLPLFFVYVFECTINQGVTPTLLYPVPRDGFLSTIIHSPRDYYPLWQLIYQSTSFISSSSIALGLPQPPASLLPLPAIVQCVIFVTIMYEAAVGFFPEDQIASSVLLVAALIAIEGACGGLAYVNVFYRINQERPDPSKVADPERARQELEFRVGSLGFTYQAGVLLASLLAIPTEMQLCRTQVARNKTFCQGLQ